MNDSPFTEPHIPENTTLLERTLYQRGTNMDGGRSTQILTILQENAITDPLGIDELDKYATQRDRWRAGLGKAIKKILKIGAVTPLWNALSSPETTEGKHLAKAGAIAIPIALAIGWISTSIKEMLSRNDIDAKYNPQKIPEKNTYLVKALKTLARLSSMDMPLCLIESKNPHLLKMAFQMSLSFAGAYHLNGRKSQGTLAFLDGDHPEFLENLLRRRKQSKMQAFREFIKNDLLTLPMNIIHATLTATITPKTLIKFTANLPITATIAFTNISPCQSAMIQDASAVPKKMLKKQAKKGLDWLEEKGYFYTHKKAGAIVDRYVQRSVRATVSTSKDLVHWAKSWQHTPASSIEERQPILAVTAAEEGRFNYTEPTAPIDIPAPQASRRQNFSDPLTFSPGSMDTGSSQSSSASTTPHSLIASVGEEQIPLLKLPPSVLPREISPDAPGTLVRRNSRFFPGDKNNRALTTGIMSVPTLAVQRRPQDPQREPLSPGPLHRPAYSPGPRR